MGVLVYIIIGIIVLVSVPILFLVLSAKRGKGGKGIDAAQSRQNEALIREANRKLTQNPNDAKALLTIADIAFKSEDYQTARTHYKSLIDLSAASPEIDELEATVRHGISCLKLGDLDEAYNSLLYARNLNKDSFDVNFHLGAVEYARNNFEKAAAFFQRAHSADDENVLAVKNLGICLYKIGRYRDCIPFLRRIMEAEPDDKDTLFALGNASFEAGQTDTAVKIFTHLRTDPSIGPTAALYCGTIYMNAKLYDKAITDLELGLRHNGVKQEIALELKYRLGFAYLKKEDINKAMSLWREISSVNSDYRDVQDLLSRYGEMSSNRKLQTYLLAPTSDFVTLCRRITMSFYIKGKTKLLNISFRQSEYVDIVAEVDTPKWSDIILFRFVRTTGVIGELLLRDLYVKLKEIKGGRGVCIAPATYSEGAKGFVEARIVDLIDKPGLIKLLARLPEEM
jgi:tetratricopeptide (TPR) repeat protein